ncbi:uncharacterized protein Dwil_GK22446 [Drosophila willistoni]|uniref:Ionotropic glutamate receptor C-terminal domain-containing protein n=1 Tax=Drosophila willistoni TaxID=7260 RepID=B4NFY8_DROWI|nr:uncharacterized protein Dwil_GK22446 [Drosophila willistoni]
MLIQPLLGHLSHLLHIIVTQYFASLSSVLIVYNDTLLTSALQLEYLSSLQLALRNLSRPLLLQWINVATLLDYNDLELQILKAVNNTVTEGFITILPQTSLFIHARYFATRNANVRLKDKRYLFLCEHEDPRVLLGMEILQFYPHHLMVRPEQTAAIALGRPAATGTPRRVDTVTMRLGMEWDGSSASADADAHADTVTTATLPHRDINFELWTQKFLGAFGNLDAIRLDAFLPNETFVSSLELYPNKLLNLQQRTLRMGSITYVPYTVTNYVAAGEGNVDPINPHKANHSIAFHGSEANLMKSFCAVHNCHLRVESYGADNWGGIYDNGTADGMLGDIYKQRVELAIGCIYNWYDQITETSATIARSSVTILGPAPAPLPSWRSNILPFNSGTWLLLIFTVLICSLILYLIEYYNYYVQEMLGQQNAMKFPHREKLQKSLLDTFALFIQQPSAPLGFNRFAARFYLATLLCATITLENIYSGQLKSLLTIPFYSAPIDTIAKWAHAQWKWAAPSIIWVHTVEHSDLVNEQIMARNFKVRDYDFLYNASFLPNYGLGIERLASGAYSFGDYVTQAAVENRIILHDDLYFDWTRAVSIRGWTLMDILNKHIRICQESGLYVHWELESIVKYLDKKTQEILLDLNNGHKVKEEPKPLNIPDISGAMFVLAFGLTFATVVMTLELFWNTFLSSRHSQ